LFLIVNYISMKMYNNNKYTPNLTYNILN